MKVYLFIILFIVVSLSSGCSYQKPYPLPIQQAESCVEMHPDSALYYLAMLKDGIKLESAETQMYYHLITIKAKDKLYINHTSDSLINIIVEFYEDYDDDNKLMEAYYYQGSVYRDMNDAPRALEAFQKVIDTGKEHPLNDLFARTYNQMGTLFAYQGLYDESLQANKEAVKNYIAQGKEYKISYTLRDIAHVYNVKQQNDSALYYYQKAYQTALATKDSAQIYNIIGELGYHYYKLGKLDIAKQYLLTAVNHREGMANTYSILGRMHKDNLQWDSAYHYLNQTIKSGDIYRQYNAYQHLYFIEVSKRNYPKAIEYNDKIRILKDSIDIMTQTEAIAKINLLYNYQHSEKENNNLKLNNKSQKNIIHSLILFLVIISILGISLYLYIKSKERMALEQARKLRRLREEQYAQSLAAIESNTQKVRELELQLKEIEEQNDNLQKELLQAQKELLEASNQQILATQNEQELLDKSLKQSDIYSFFQQARYNTSIKITDEHWSQLQTAIDATYRNFTERLYNLYPRLSQLELQICYLTKISISPTEIATFVNRSKSAVTNARTRLYKKIHGTEGTGEMLDKFIIDL